MTSGDERVAAADPGTAGRQRWRTILTVVLIGVGSVLAPLAGVAVWARDHVTNTDRYVRTVAPLARDPAIQRAIDNYRSVPGSSFNQRRAG